MNVPMRKHLAVWALLASLAAPGATLPSAGAERSLLIQRLPDGSRLTLLGVTYGATHSLVQDHGAELLRELGEVARVAVMLAENDYVTRQTINVNGGWYMS